MPEAPTTARILLVEDNATNRVFAERVMQKAGHTVVTAENGQVALEHIAKQTFDIVFMDVQMPVMDGLDASRAIRESERGTDQELPIIALTAQVLEEQIQQCLDVGMNMHLGKPVYGSDLLDVIHKLLNDTDRDRPYRSRPATHPTIRPTTYPTGQLVRRNRLARAATNTDDDRASDDDTPTTTPAHTAKPPAPDVDNRTDKASPGDSAKATEVATVAADDGPRTDVFDSERLLDMLDHDRALIDDMLIEFITQQTAIVDELHESLESNDSASAAKHAHKIKGSLLTLCAHASAKAASELEQQLRAGDIELGRDTLATLVRKLDELNAEFRRQGFAAET